MSRGLIIKRYSSVEARKQWMVNIETFLSDVNHTVQKARLMIESAFPRKVKT